ncbi:MAG: helix-turn-helix transcriptional regulator [Phycisphaeraceae bacterium]|nr:helix-turn-helix transcriptional regulator [Phycisphaeraceae bacterium]
MSKILNELKRSIRNGELTRYRIAQISGLTEAALSRLMSGERGLSIDAAEKLADALDLEIIIRPKSRRKGK